MANKHAKAKNLRARALVSLVAIIVVVAVCAYLGLCGFGKGTMINYLKPWGDAISLGLDLRGGVYTVYQAENNGDPDFDTKMESTVSILTSRLTRQGFTEATVTRQGSDRIRVEIPNVSDPNQILTIIGTPAQLYFVDESGNNLMEGGMVKNAQAAQDQDGKPCIAFELTDEGAKIFAEARRLTSARPSPSRWTARPSPARRSTPSSPAARAKSPATSPRMRRRIWRP